MNKKGYDSTSHGGVNTYSNLQKNQVFKQGNSYQNRSPYETKNNWKNDSAYSNNNNENFEIERPKYKRFNDLKILNEKMMHMANNTLSDDSHIEILSQGEKGEIKNILSERMIKVSLVPALVSFALGLVVTITDNIIITIFSTFVYFAIFARVFFYPAKLYYENIRHKTTSSAKLFFEEMDYWYKISVVKIYIYLVISSILMFIASFYQDEVIEFLISFFPNTNGINKDLTSDYLSSISFSVSLKLVALLNIVMLVVYSKFVNKEKSQAEKLLKDKKVKIRNETISRVQQIQKDKNAD